MESAERKRRVVRKSHVLSSTYTSTTVNGHEYSSTKDTSNNWSQQSKRADGGNAVDDEGEGLEKGGEFSIVDDRTPTFDRVSPKQVSDFYKSLGEWQNVLPKTDYTYSPASKYYRHKINGTFPVIPNMSRRDLWKNREIIDNEINSYCAKNYRYEEDSYAERSSTPAKSRRWLAGKFSGLTKNAPLAIRNTYLGSLRRYRRFSWWLRDLRSSSGPPPASTSGGSRAWRNLLLVAFVGFLLYFLASSGDVVSSEFFRPESVTQPFVKIVPWFYSLVVSAYELTCSSASFLLSVISIFGRRAFDTACAVTYAPVYKFVLLLWPSYDEKPTGEPPRGDLDPEHIDRLFRRFLDENTATLVKNVVGSDDFASFVDDKLRNVEERQNRQFEELARQYETLGTTFGRKLAVLDEKMADARTDEANDFKEEIRVLREEIAVRESRIETEVTVLLAALVDLEKGSGLDDLKSKFAAVFASIESAHVKIDKLSAELASHVKNATDTFDSAFERSKDDLKHDLRLSVEEMVAKKLREWQTSSAKTEGRPGDLEDYVKEVVRQALEVYDADKTGQADFALESQGGIILSTRCTETKTANAQFSILGIPLWHTSRSPRTVIQPGVHPGECWAFPGSTGYLVIQLSERIVVTGFSVEHIPRSLASNGSIDSAPKDFSVWALRWESDPEPESLGTFQFEVDGLSLQYFEAARLPEPYQIVELKILSNHGKIDYTCLYRFRVHGIPA